MALALRGRALQTRRYVMLLSYQCPPAVPRLFLMTFVGNIIKDYTNHANTGKTIILCWYPVMSIFVAMRGLTLQQNQLFLCSLQIWSFRHVNLYHVFPSSVLTNGKIYGTVAREINFILFTPRSALLSIAKIFPTTIPSCSTDCELLILVSLTHTYWVVMTPQPVNLAEFHSQ